MTVLFGAMRYWALAPIGLGLLTAGACHPPPDVRTPKAEVVLAPAEAAATYEHATHVFDSRCVVCHGCYDAPCQLKLGTYEGIERGASDKLVYDGARLVAMDPTRLGVDAHNLFEWRQKGFHPVLPEGKQADPRASLLVRMLDLKRKHPLTSDMDLSKEFSLELNRKQTCTDDAHFEDYAKEHPTWGMPYALPAVSSEDETAIVDWVRAGAPHPADPPLSPDLTQSMASWETFLNDDSPRGQLVARYIYEHLFLASIRFSDSDKTLFRIVRSKSEPGRPIFEVATRRPFEDPKVPRVYYRFEKRLERPLDKTWMPYLLDGARLDHWKKLFYDKPWSLAKSPGYEPEVAANPFRAFEAIPTSARYRFMLEESQFTIQGFIKGPVCRGQIALNVIEDRFWVTFVDPDVPWQDDEAKFLSTEKLDLDMPAEGGSNAWPTLWLKYGNAHERYVKAKGEFLAKATKNGQAISMKSIWDGDGNNTNAALTIFRHFDSATVVRGLIGGPPKTAWVIDYPLLERIHYLLVAGYDVFGNVSHQLGTRLYMDYLRMEGETAFLALLPPDRRQKLVDHWYRGVTGDAKARVSRDLVSPIGAPGLSFATATPELEVFDMLRKRIGPALVTKRELSGGSGAEPTSALTKLDGLRGRAASFMPETAFLLVDSGSDAYDYFTLSRESGYTNVAHLFQDDKRRLPDEDELAVTAGFLGAYPNAIFVVAKSDVPAFMDAVTKLDSPDAYRALRTKYGVLRNSDRFWTISDRINADHAEKGLFDYNRLEAY